AGSERQLVNVAAGTAGTDAVNLDQLNATLATANAYTDSAVATGGTAANAYTDNREVAIRSDMAAADTATLDAANAHTDDREAAIRGDMADADAATLASAQGHADAGDAATLDAANAYTDRQLSAVAGFDPTHMERRMDGFDQRLGVHDRRINIVGALASAMSMVAPDARVRGANQFSVGVGHFRDRQAIAVGYSRMVSPRAALRIGAAFADSESTAGVGFNVGW